MRGRAKRMSEATSGSGDAVLVGAGGGWLDFGGKQRRAGLCLYRLDTFYRCKVDRDIAVVRAEQRPFIRLYCCAAVVLRSIVRLGIRYWFGWPEWEIGSS